MKVNKKYKYIISALSLVALICLSVVGMFFFADSARTQAVTNYNATTQIGKLTLDNYESNSNNMVFNGDKMQELYSALLGKENATLSDIKAALASGNLNSNNFRTNNPNKNDVVVEIGGLKWAAVYLAYNNTTDNDPILTLWLTDSTQLPTGYSTSVWND